MKQSEFLQSLVGTVEQIQNRLTVLKTRIEAELDVRAPGATTTSDPSASESTPSADA